MELSNLKKRLQYNGGARTIDRMAQGKLRSLKQALTSSYQAATAIMQDGKEFRCLINPNKISMESDDKMLSMPYKDTCLNIDRDTDIDTGVKCGTVIEWKENKTHWLIYSQYLQETAYFRGLMRQCDGEPLEIDGKQYWYYLKGADEKTIDWQKTKNFIFNNLSYTIEIYISNTPEINEFFHRFKKCKVKGKPFEVQAVDSLSIDGLLIVYLREDFTNEWEDAQSDPVAPSTSSIIGPYQVYPYDVVEYYIQDPVSSGSWHIDKNGCILYQDNSKVKIEITTGKSGNFTLTYKAQPNENIVQTIDILSL